MAKPTVTFVCNACGASFPQWLGRCTGCGAWESLEEQKKTKGRAAPLPGMSGVSKPLALDDVPADSNDRTSTGISELDRVLGGGVVRGGVTLVGGDPGIGKSTLLLQALAGLAARGCKSLYVTGEESAAQTASRAKRLGATSQNLFVVCETDLEAIDNAIAELQPAALVIDSVQMMRSPGIDGAAGTVTQLREACARLSARAKHDGVSTFLVGHVTKDGMLAGPKVLEHMVDTVLWFEGERGHALRTLRAHKNRFGSATEVGVFEMTSSGLKEVKNPSALLLAERPANASGSIVAATSEGSRPLLVEVQALVGSSQGSGRRATSGADGARLAMILAVLERKVGLSIGMADVFVNIAGGVRIDEPALDLPVAIALASSFRNIPVKHDVACFGEVGLAGEVRRVPRSLGRLTEAGALGFRRVIAPPGADEGAWSGSDKKKEAELKNVEVVFARSVEEAIAAAL
jgi:DNA repair protein RadA/Sms